MIWSENRYPLFGIMLWVEPHFAPGRKSGSSLLAGAFVQSGER